MRRRDDDAGAAVIDAGNRAGNNAVRPRGRCRFHFASPVTVAMGPRGRIGKRESTAGGKKSRGERRRCESAK